MKKQLKNLRKAFSLILLFAGIPVFGQTGFSLGIGGEANIVTLDDKGYALGGGISADYRFNPSIAAGLRVDAFYDRTQLVSFENRFFARWYFLRPGPLEFFLQGDAGLMITFRKPEMNAENSRGSPAVGAATGLRILLPDNLYLEPYVRAGYPYLVGGGLLLGFSPRIQTDRSGGSVDKNQQKQQPQQGPQEQPAENLPPQDLKTGEELVVFRDVNTIPEIAALSIDPYIYFAANNADFSGLDKKTIENNYRLLREIADFLKANLEYNLIIEGHANPVTNTKNEEEASLNPLSIERADVAASTLIYYGVSRKRLIIAGSGGTKALVPWIDREHWNLNRRVEFLLIRQTRGDKKQGE